MKAKLNLCIAGMFILHLSYFSTASQVIRINQLGYMPQSVKVAVFLSDNEVALKEFTLHDAITGKEVFRGNVVASEGHQWGLATVYRLNFSEFCETGGYYIKAGQAQSTCFRINWDVYQGSAGFLLHYLRQQRCGYNPFLKDSCHVYDGIIVDHPTKSGQFIDVVGGWHDASDYLQYSATSVNALFQLMFAYENYPEVFGDHYDENGHLGGNNVPDIVDEIRWGLQWMLKMNPSTGEFYNQIADDRDHAGYRLPVNDPADYGLGAYRPVYFVTGKPQGLSRFKNNSTGVSSVAGKFSSAFAMGAKLFEETDGPFSQLLKQKAMDAWNFALSDTGFTQTACYVSPYFYEESNFVDDLELAAIQLYRLTRDSKFRDEAVYWGEKEPVTPWIEKSKARHYQYYPFVNLGHHYLGMEGKHKFMGYHVVGLKLLYDRGKEDPFFNGLPFIWCSNNLVAAALTQARLCALHFKNEGFAEMEASLRDWLFGCNPWGTAMICGLPGAEDSPMNPHSSYIVLKGTTTHGGLVDGPVYSSVFNSLVGVELTVQDEYAPWNKGKAVYHDDTGDYSTNEPTLDGTASLCYYLASLEAEGCGGQTENKFTKDTHGAITRLNRDEKIIYLVFTADSHFEGGSHVLQVLDKKGIEGSFFFTGNFLRNKTYSKLIKKIIKAGHYIGPHSDGHLLYCDWHNRDSMLVTRSLFETDLIKNFEELKKFDIFPEQARYFIPPYEWYNRKIVDWGRHLGLETVTFTPGTGTNADYTVPGSDNYQSSVRIYSNLLKFVKEEENGLNGAIILIHPGTVPERTDKFYRYLEDLIRHFSSRGYQFKSLK